MTLFHSVSSVDCFIILWSSVPDPGSYVFGPSRSWCGSVIYLYGTGSGSRSGFFDQPAKKLWFLLFCDFFLTFIFEEIWNVHCLPVVWKKGIYTVRGIDEDRKRTWSQLGNLLICGEFLYLSPHSPPPTARHFRVFCNNHYMLKQLM